MPFTCTGDKLKEFGKLDKLDFDIHFDVVDGSLPFLIGLPTLTAMNATLNFIRASLTMEINSVRYCLKLQRDTSHIYLQMQSTVVYASHARQQGTPQNINTTYYSPSALPPSPTSTNDQPNTTSGETIEAPAVVLRTDKIVDTLSQEQLKKFHIQLQHGSFNQIKNYLQSAKLWNSNLVEPLRTILNNCPCVLQKPPPSHSVISSRPPNDGVHGEISVDIISLGGHLYLHVIDRSTRWSELGHLPSKRLETQIRIFKSIYLYRHGPPSSIRGDEEYNKPEFLHFCESIETNFIAIAANHHEANGVIERANRTIRMYYDKLRLAHGKSSVHECVERATFAKNICRNADSVSPFERLYGRTANIMQGLPSIIHPNIASSLPNPNSVTTSRESSKRVKRAIKSQLRCPIKPSIGDMVYFWRDKQRWLGPARVLNLGDHAALLNHNGHKKIADFSRIKIAPKVSNPPESPIQPEVDEPIPGPSTTPELNTSTTLQNALPTQGNSNDQPSTQMNRQVREAASLVREAVNAYGPLSGSRLRRRSNETGTHPVSHISYTDDQRVDGTAHYDPIHPSHLHIDNEFSPSDNFPFVCDPIDEPYFDIENSNNTPRTVSTEQRTTTTFTDCNMEDDDETCYHHGQNDTVPIESDYSTLYTTHESDPCQIPGNRFNNHNNPTELQSGDYTYSTTNHHTASRSDVPKSSSTQYPTDLQPKSSNLKLNQYTHPKTEGPEFEHSHTDGTHYAYDDSQAKVQPCSDNPWEESDYPLVHNALGEENPHDASNWAGQKRSASIASRIPAGVLKTAGRARISFVPQCVGAYPRRT